MFDFFLNSSALSFGEKLSIGGQVTLLGMGTVFAVLILLWVLVEVLHLLLGHPAEKKTSAPAKTEAPAPSVAPSPVVSETPSESGSAPADDLAIIAVITAAIAAASGQSPSSFRVVSFKRANNKFSYRK